MGIENVFSAAEVTNLQKITDKFVERSRTIEEDDTIFELESGHTPQMPKVRRLRNPVGQDPVYDQALRNERVLDIVAQLIGPEIRTNGNKLNMKQSGRMALGLGVLPLYERRSLNGGRMHRRYE